AAVVGGRRDDDDVADLVSADVRLGVAHEAALVGGRGDTGVGAVDAPCVEEGHGLRRPAVVGQRAQRHAAGQVVAGAGDVPGDVPALAVRHDAVVQRQGAVVVDAAAAVARAVAGKGAVGYPHRAPVLDAAAERGAVAGKGA